MIDKTEIGTCVFCIFHEYSVTASTYTPNGRCLLGQPAAGKDGGMYIDPTKFGCISWEEKQGNEKNQ